MPVKGINPDLQLKGKDLDLPILTKMGGHTTGDPAFPSRII